MVDLWSGQVQAPTERNGFAPPGRGTALRHGSPRFWKLAGSHPIPKRERRGASLPLWLGDWSVSMPSNALESRVTCVRCLVLLSLRLKMRVLLTDVVATHVHMIDVFLLPFGSWSV
jgi:hypothetical protein